MQIHVCLLPDPTFIDAGCTAVVIDTLRFTTTACEALSSGAKDIFVGSDIEKMRSLAGRPEESDSWLCGERHCHLIEGFHLGNSPFEYQAEVVRGRRLFFTTTNGTRAIEAARSAKSVLLGALVNRSALAAHLVASKPDEIILVCSGTDRKIAAEDTIAAGAIVDAIRGRFPDLRICNDEAQLALAAWRYGSTSEKTLAELLRNADGGNNLVNAGYEKDIQFAARVDSIECVPRNSPQAWQIFTAS
ncbi:MAG: 2-phosphosulfolactate phosphatase [Aureliella sp.]